MGAHNAADIAGQRFGRLVAIERVGTSQHKRAVWSLRCDCGNSTFSEVQKVRSGSTISCGCAKRERIARLAKSAQPKAAAANRTHGHCGSRDYGKDRRGRSSEYRSWEAMRARCNNPNNNRFAIYGARGIRVCERWALFENFIADMGPKPSRGHSIDRIDVNGNYEPGNCRWATAKEQAANKR